MLPNSLLAKYSKPNEEDDDDDELDENEYLERDISTLRRGRGWALLKKHLNEGTLLLRASSSTHKNAHSARKAFVDELHDGMYFSIKSCLIAIAVYMSVSIAMYTCILEPQWTVIDSCYFAVATFTTLGYGDLVPTNTASVIFTCFYTITGVASMGIVLGVLGNRLIRKHDILLEECQTAAEEEVMNMFGDSHSTTSTHWWSNSSSRSKGHPGQSERSIVTTIGENVFGGGHWNWHQFLGMVLCAFLLVSAMAIRSGWSVLTTVYYLIITSCTIGYGDLVPETQTERLLAVFYIPLSCFIMGQWLGYVAQRIVDLQSSNFRKQKLHRRELTQDDLDAMDLNGNGKVSWAEFLEFMLVAMDKVDHDLLEELHSYFHHLDVSHTGELSQEDLVEAARQKLRSIRSKLALAAYKKKVVRLGKFPQRRQIGEALVRMAVSVRTTCRNISLALFLDENGNIAGGDPEAETKGSRGAFSTRSFRPSPKKAANLPLSRNTSSSLRNFPPINFSRGPVLSPTKTNTPIGSNPQGTLLPTFRKARYSSSIRSAIPEVLLEEESPSPSKEYGSFGSFERKNEGGTINATVEPQCV
eukprot:Nitzschia sp. Nitz4//scaffold95_size97785//25507//27332//NITZ4_004659-RA/size97785-augustus-gene-0.105-mRNA-1//-1//CDS//3329560448//378//frame0